MPRSFERVDGARSSCALNGAISPNWKTSDGISRPERGPSTTDESSSAGADCLRDTRGDSSSSTGPQNSSAGADCLRDTRRDSSSSTGPDDNSSVVRANFNSADCGEGGVRAHVGGAALAHAWHAHSR